MRYARGALGVSCISASGYEVIPARSGLMKSIMTVVANGMKMCLS